MDSRMRSAEQLLHRLDEKRRAALARGDLKSAAAVEELIVKLEEHATLLLAHSPEFGTPLAPPATERETMARPHIFAINAESDFLNLLRVLLQDERYNVTTTNFVPRTFEQIAVLQPTLLIVDLSVGQRAGWDLLARLHAATRTRHIPVIVVSNDRYLLGRARAEAARYGGEEFLVKSLDMDELLRTIEELTGVPRGR